MRIATRLRGYRVVWTGMGCASRAARNSRRPGPAPLEVSFLSAHGIAVVDGLGQCPAPTRQSLTPVAAPSPDRLPLRARDSSAGASAVCFETDPERLPWMRRSSHSRRVAGVSDDHVRCAETLVSSAASSRACPASFQGRCCSIFPYRPQADTATRSHTGQRDGSPGSQSPEASLPRGTAAAPELS